MNAADDLDDNSTVAQLVSKYNQQTQILLDKAAPLTLPRWSVWAVSLLAYALRVWLLKGFYIVTYGLGIYNLNLLLGFITPQVDPELEPDAPSLPTKSDQEFKPFVRRLPEFKFWSVMRHGVKEHVGMPSAQQQHDLMRVLCVAAGGHQ